MTDKDEHINQWLPLAYRVARDYSRHCLGTAEADDIRSAALEGLVKAANTFVPGRAGFYTHARNMIVWAICEHRSESHMLMTRGVRTNARKRGEEPPALVSTTAIPDFDDRVSTGDSDAAFDAVAAAEDVQAVHRALSQLPRRTADAIRMYYFDELTLAEIGRRIGVTRQRINQIVSDGLECMGMLVKNPRRRFARPAPVRSQLPKGTRASKAWGPVDAHGFSTHYLCDGTGKIRLRQVRQGVIYWSTRACFPCKGVGHRLLAEPLALAV